MKITYSNEVLNYQHGQLDCEAGIFVDNEIAGLVQYTLFDEELSVKHIFVRPEFRRQGFGSRLMKYIQKENPEYKYKPSMKTELGAAFKHKDLPLESYRAKFVNALLEMSFESLDVKDVVNKKLIDDYYANNYVLDLFVYSYANENGLNAEELTEDDEFKESKEFKEWLLYEMETRFYDTVNKFRYEIIDGETIPIWRKMTVKENWVDYLKMQGLHLGIYWSWDPNAAEEHWGYDKSLITVRLESEIKVDYIDWIETIKLNMHPNYEEEKEIRLFRNTPIKIISMQHEDGSEIDISAIKDKIFKA